MGNSYLKRSHWRLRRLSDPVLSVTKVHSSVMGWKFEGCGLTKHSACNGPRPSFRSDWVGLRIPPLPLGSTDPGLCPGGWLVQAPSGPQVLVCAQEADLSRPPRVHRSWSVPRRLTCAGFTDSRGLWLSVEMGQWKHQWGIGVPWLYAWWVTKILLHLLWPAPVLLMFSLDSLTISSM